MNAPTERFRDEAHRRRGQMGAAIIAIAWLGMAVAFTLAADHLFARPTSQTMKTPQIDVPPNVRLAQAFTTALNTHDVDTLVDLFTDEDSGPTLSADVHAWHKFEIHQWAMLQIQASIRVSAFDYRPTEHGAIWRADVYRGDWAELGVSTVRVWNEIWVHNGKLAHFRSTPRDLREIERLGSLWRPGSPPRHIDRPKLNGAHVAST
jgi:hypothetical protein